MNVGPITATAPREPGEFKLAWALGASVLVHLLLVALSYLTPMFQAAEPPPQEDDAVLEFTFAPPSDDPDAPQESARGDVPFETPPSPPPPPPQEQDRPVVDDSPGDADQSAPPEEPSPPQEQAPPSPEPLPEPPMEDPEPPDPEASDAPLQDETAEGIDQPSERPGTQAPETLDSELLPGAETDPQQAAPKSKRSLDLGSALSTFQDSMDKARASRPPAAPGNSGPKQTVFTPNDMGPPPVQGGPYGILEFTSRDYDWSDYARQIYWEILRAWYNRLYQTSADFEKWAYNNRSWILDHSSGIEFVIERTGNVTGIQLLQPSGCNPLDDSALDALSEVILPKLPADFPRDQELVRARFIATGDIRFLRQSLAAGKAAGRF